MRARERLLHITSDSGVYCVRCTINGRIYVGQAANMRTRVFSHITNLRRNRHHNKALQDDWNLHGETAFEYGILAFEYLRVGPLIFSRESSEALFIREYQTNDPIYGYNLNAQNELLHNSDEYNQQIAALAGYWGFNPNQSYRRTVIERSIAFAYQQLISPKESRS